MVSVELLNLSGSHGYLARQIKLRRTEAFYCTRISLAGRCPFCAPKCVQMGTTAITFCSSPDLYKDLFLSTPDGT